MRLISAIIITSSLLKKYSLEKTQNNKTNDCYVYTCHRSAACGLWSSLFLNGSCTEHQMQPMTHYTGIDRISCLFL